MQLLLLLGLTAGRRAGCKRRSPKDGPQNSAVNTSDSKNRVAATGPVKGSNSFTEGEARSRIQDKGLSNVTALKKDDDGIWRGRAMQSGLRAGRCRARTLPGQRLLRRRRARDERPVHAGPGSSHDFPQQRPLIGSARRPADTSN